MDGTGRLAKVIQIRGGQSPAVPSIGAGSMAYPASGSEVLPGVVIRPHQVANALLPDLPPPLTLLHGPLLVTIQYWPDGSVVADLPACAISGEGITDTAAIEDLGEVMLEWAQGIVKLGDDNLGGALLRQWTAFKALVDVSRL